MQLLELCRTQIAQLADGFEACSDDRGLPLHAMRPDQRLGVDVGHARGADDRVADHETAAASRLGLHRVR